MRGSEGDKEGGRESRRGRKTGRVAHVCRDVAEGERKGCRAQRRVRCGKNERGGGWGRECEGRKRGVEQRSVVENEGERGERGGRQGGGGSEEGWDSRHGCMGGLFWHLTYNWVSCLPANVQLIHGP